MLYPLTRGHSTGSHLHTQEELQFCGGSNTGPIQGPSPNLAAPTNCSSFIACTHGDNSGRYTTRTVGHVFSTGALAQCFQRRHNSNHAIPVAFTAASFPQPHCHPSGIHSCIISASPACTHSKTFSLRTAAPVEQHSITPASTTCLHHRWVGCLL